MPTYISLLNWTDQGIRNVRDTLQRSERTAELAQRHGVRIEQVYWTLGAYDIAIIVEAPDDQAFMAFLLEIDSAGSVRSSTLRAYDQEEMSAILQRLVPAPGT